MVDGAQRRRPPHHHPSRATSLDAVGYLYELTTAGFEVVDDWQWISRIHIQPVERHVITARDYAHWIV